VGEAYVLQGSPAEDRILRSHSVECIWQSFRRTELSMKRSKTARRYMTERLPRVYFWRRHDVHLVALSMQTLQKMNKEWIEHERFMIKLELR
jgi:hypothetical protein